MVKRKIKTKSKPQKSRVSKNKNQKPKNSVNRTGASGFAEGARRRQQQEENYERMKETPWDFRLRVGESAEVVVVDKPGENFPFFTTLHTFKGSDGKWKDEVCIADTGEPCPLCADQGKGGSYMMILTVLDRRTYTARDGTKVKASKKLMKVKGRNLAKFERQFEKFDKDFRGLKIRCERSTDKEAAIGEDLEFSRKKTPEATLKKFKDLAKPADYKKIFSIPTAKEIAKRHGLTAGRAAGSEDLDDDDDDEDLDNVEW